ncbi:MAG: RDD family protein [Phycisphaeraceae bacterium]|nr:RDD family protein [Phycisphaeraceae bacterium]MCW5762626.1 RDD family protein [Phycisphaeraceae bacterium]
MIDLRRISVLIVMTSIMAIGAVSEIACGQIAAASPVNAATGQSHAWAIIGDDRQVGSARSYVLLHAPPRHGVGAASAGSVQVARVFDEMPRAIGAYRNKVYLAFELQGRDGVARVRVRALDAVWRGRVWVYEPRDRLEAHPLLSARGTVVALSIAPERIVVVMLQSDDSLSAHALELGAWKQIELPAAYVRANDTNGQHGEVAFHIGGLDVLAMRDGDETRLSVLDPTGVNVPVASASFGSEAVLVPIWCDGPRMLGVRWADAEDARAKGRLLRFESIEVSMSSGAVLHAGEVPREGALPTGEVRVLGIMLVALLISVLVIVLRRSRDDGSISLPAHTALAEPLRRILASALDFGLAAQVAGVVFGLSFWEIISLLVMVPVDGAWAAVPATFGVGLVIGTLSESFSGRSIGKWLVGCRVVRVHGTIEHPYRVGFGRSLVRNAIKWTLPPVAALALFDPNGRHRGDQIAGVAVVVQLEPDNPRT